MAAGAWDEVRARLAAQLADLADGELVVLGEPAGEPGPPRGLLRRRTPPPATRFVQVRRDEDQLYAECVGSTAFGGDWEVDDTTHERLRDLGWLVPGEVTASAMEPSYPAYWRLLPVSGAAELAGTCAGTLDALGADPSTLVWRREG